MLKRHAALLRLHEFVVQQNLLFLATLSCQRTRLQEQPHKSIRLEKNRRNRGHPTASDSNTVWHPGVVEGEKDITAAYPARKNGHLDSLGSDSIRSKLWCFGMLELESCRLVPLLHSFFSCVRSSRIFYILALEMKLERQRSTVSLPKSRCTLCGDAKFWASQEKKVDFVGQLGKTKTTRGWSRRAAGQKWKTASPQQGIPEFHAA